MVDETMPEETVTIPMVEYRLLAAIHGLAAELAITVARTDADASADLLARYEKTSVTLGRHLMSRADDRR
jgi:hypothetical protein